MKLTGMGKLVILILALGVALGGWRIFQQSKGGKSDGGFGINLPNSSGNNGGSNGGNNGDDGSNNGNGSGSNNGNNGANANGGSSGGDGKEILLVTSASKKGWLQDQIARFNQSHNGQYHVTTQFLETREAMHAILEGGVRPVLYSPSATIWSQRLQSAWSQKHGGADILSVNDPASYRVFLRTPLVFVTTRNKAKFLRPLLGRTGGWQALRRLGTGQLRAPWGKWRWSHADPLSSNSGMMTIGAILADYSDQVGQNDYNSVVKSATFRQYVRDVERGLVFDLPAEGGSSALFKAFVADTTRYDAITTYESNALEAADQNPDLAVIYPRPTVVSENVVAVLNGDWISEEQKAGARAFLQFLGTPESFKSAVANKLRPAQAGDSSLDNELNRLRERGFQTGFTTVELPPYEALNSAAFNWRSDVKR